MARMVSFRVSCGACKGTGYRPDPERARPVDRRKELIERRSRIMKTVADEESPFGSLEYLIERAAQSGASELEELLTEWDESAGPLETGVTWRCLGDVLCKAVEARRSGPLLRRAGGAEPRLERAFQAYGKAESFLREATTLANSPACICVSGVHCA
jgi:hypothetical protein